MISRYVFRRLRGSKGRTAVTLSAIVLTVLFTVSIGVLFGSGQASFVTFFTDSADYDLLITSQGNGSLSRPFFNVSEVQGNISGIPHEGAFPVVATVAASFHTTDGNVSFVPLIGVDPAYDRGHLRSLQGNYSLNGTDVVLSPSAAHRLNASLGDTIPIFYYEGAVDYSTATAINFSDPDFFAHVRTTNVTVGGIGELVGRLPGSPTFYILRGYNETAAMLNATGLTNQMVVLLPESLYDFTDTNDPSHAAKARGTQIAQALGPGYHVEAVKAAALTNALQTARATGLIANMFAIVFPSVAGILVAATLNLSVEEKARDMAIMRLIGARRRDVGRVLLLEAGTLLGVGIPVGLVGGLILPGILVKAFFAGDQTISPSVSGVATQLAIALTVIVLFLIMPLRRALAASPAQAVYQVRSQGEYRYAAREGVDRRIILAGAVLFAAILYATFAVPYILVFNQDVFIQFFLGSTLILISSLAVALLWAAPPLEQLFVRLLRPLTPKVNTLTVASVRRNIRRNASTNLIFSMIVGIMLFFTSFFSGIVASVDVNATYGVGADVRLAAFTSFTPGFADSVKTFPNVSQIALRPVRVEAEATNLVTTEGANIGLIGLDPHLMDVLLPGQFDAVEGPISALRTLDNRSIALSADTAAGLQVHVGDLVSIQSGAVRDFFTVTVTLRSLPGFTDVFEEQQGIQGSPGAFVAWDRYLEFGGLNDTTIRFSSIYVDAKPGTNTTQMAQDFGDLYGVFVDFAPISRDQLASQAREVITFLTFVSEVILVILVIVAVFSLTVNLYASVQERSYEIGVVRSIGLRRSGVLSSTLLEGLAIAMVSAGIGVVIGVLISSFVIFFINIFSPIDLGYELPRQVLLVLLIATALFAVLGSLGPARSVSRRPLISLLRKIE